MLYEECVILMFYFVLELRIRQRAISAPVNKFLKWVDLYEVIVKNSHQMIWRGNIEWSEAREGQGKRWSEPLELKVNLLRKAIPVMSYEVRWESQDKTIKGTMRGARAA